jgi:hypothetical protein
MKAIVQERFGPPDVLRLVDIDLPEPGPDDVLVRVHAAALNPYDWHMLRGDPRIARLMGVGLTKPKARVAGVDGAGRVEAAGANVRNLRPGDEVLGLFRGSFAEYALAGQERVAPKPASLTFEEAAAVPMAASTALRGIRDVGEVRSGQRVLVNGAAGGVGTFQRMPAGTYDIELRESGSNQVIFTARNFEAEGGHVYILAAGAGAGRPVELVEMYDSASAEVTPESGVKTGAGGLATGRSSWHPLGGALLVLTLLGSALLVMRYRSPGTR